MPIDHPATDVKRAHAGGYEFGCHARCFVDRPAPRDPFVTGNAQRDRQGVADLGANRGERLQHHPHPAACRVASILVATSIALWGKERAQQHIPVCGVQLDTVVSGLGGATHRGLEQIEHLAQLLLADLGRRSPGEVGGNHRRPQRRDTEHLRSQAVGPGVHDLRLDLGAVFVYRLHQRPVRIYRVVGGQVQTTGGLGVTMVDSGGAQRDQADTTLGAGREVVAGAL